MRLGKYSQLHNSDQSKEQMKIGIHPLFTDNNRIHQIIEQLQNLDITVEIIETLSNYDLALNATKRDDKLDFLLTPLHSLPIKRTPLSKIWALMERKDFNNVLLVRKEIQDTSMPLSLPKDAKVYHPEKIIIDGLAEIRDDVIFCARKSTEILSQLNEGEIHFAVIEKMFLNENIDEHFLSIVLNEREFGHQPGQGCWALVGNSDCKYGPLVRQLHHAETASVSNIERKLVTDEIINPHSEIDHLGNYQLWIFEKSSSGLRKVHLAQSTKNEIGERAMKLLG